MLCWAWVGIADVLVDFGTFLDVSGRFAMLCDILQHFTTLCEVCEHFATFCDILLAKRVKIVPKSKVESHFLLIVC